MQIKVSLKVYFLPRHQSISFLIGPPEILNNQSEITERNVTVKWTKPRHKKCSITMYSIHYRVIEPITEKSREINITDASFTSYELHLQYSKTYRVVAFAWSDLGRSVESNAWQVKTAQGKKNGRNSHYRLTASYLLLDHSRKLTRNAHSLWVYALYIRGGKTKKVTLSTLQLTVPTKSHFHRRHRHSHTSDCA